MKKISFAAVAALAIALPGVAQAQSGGTAHPYIGAQVGMHNLGVDEDDFTGVPGLDIDDSALIYGAYAGVDFDIAQNAVIGVEANFNLGNGPIDNEFGAAARIGYRTDNGSVLYVRAGYQWINIDPSGLTGLTITDAQFDAAGGDDTGGDYLVGVGADIVVGGNARLRVGVDTLAFDTIRPTVGVNFAF
jgi:opacity protein-like surface antigen